MRHQKKYKPYVRRAKSGDYGADVRTAMLLNFRHNVGWSTYVLVQRGFRHRVIACGKSRLEVMQSPLFVRSGRMTFKQWSKSVQKICREKEASV